MVARMRLFLLTALAMAAFAANSVLNRMAVGQGWIGPLSFALVRLLAGAAMLALVLGVRVALRRGVVCPGIAGLLAGVGGLLVYLVGFSLAYRGLGAGTGALILFGMVQITMFAGAVVTKEPVPPARWLGAWVAFGGLLVLLAPGSASALDGASAMLMALAGAGWGIYSLAGRRQADALAATAANFLLAAPVLLLGVALLPMSAGAVPTTMRGLGLAVLSGAVTSGMGYALWYALLPSLGAARAGVAQLTVPLIAAAGGAVLLAEVPSWRFAMAAVLVLGGVALASRQSGLTRR